MTVCVYLFFPETKGRSLEEMDRVFDGSVFAFRNKFVPTEEHPTEKVDAEAKDYA